MNIEILLTSGISDNIEFEIMSCFNSTFFESKSDSYFRWKYRNNPFGESIHVLVKETGRIISTRAFWRLDVDGEESYQCVDTSVLPEFQGRGIFGISTRAALVHLAGKPIYNYPNDNSKPAYLKYGWRIHGSASIKVNTRRAMLKWAPIIPWDLKTLKWRFENCSENDYFASEYNGRTYILRQKKRGAFVLLGYTDYDLDLPKVNPLFIFSYDHGAPGLRVSRRNVILLIRNHDFKTLPSYLFDMM